MGRIAGIPPPEIEVRDISIQVQFLAFPQIGVAVVVGVGGEDFSSKVLLTVPQTLEILQSSLQHGGSMGMILTAAKGFGVDDYLVFAIDEGLAVITLDDAMGRFHLGRLVVREVAADLLACGPILVVLSPRYKFEKFPGRIILTRGRRDSYPGVWVQEAKILWVDGGDAGGGAAGRATAALGTPGAGARRAGTGKRVGGDPDSPQGSPGCPNGPIEGRAMVYFTIRHQCSSLELSAFPHQGAWPWSSLPPLGVGQRKDTTSRFLPPFRPTLWGIVWGMDF